MEKKKANQLFSKVRERKRKTDDLFFYILHFPVKFKLSPDIVIFIYFLLKKLLGGVLNYR